MHRIGSPLALPLPGLATPDDLQPEQKKNKQTEAGNMKLKKQEKPKPKLNPSSQKKKRLPNGYHLLPKQTTTTTTTTRD
jgi:hypothetical protein